ncbi:MAG: hypothetical protein R6U17_07545 [Thermoplasmata archaeon]
MITMGLDEMDSDHEEAECPTCGAVIPLDAVECPECGQIFEEGDEDLWGEEEASEEGLEEEEEWDDIVEEEPNKTRFYSGIIVTLLGLGMAMMSWFHNEIGVFHDMGIGNYDGYGPVDMTMGIIGIIIAIIGIVIILMWKKQGATEEIPEDELEEELEEDFI